MITFFSKFFMKPGMDESSQRGTMGIVCGIVGILLNILLFSGKFLAGLLSHSIAITADAFNNLSDAGSSLITLIGFKLASQEADKEHPFGHGRMEYLAGLVVAELILVMGFELVKDSVKKILSPEETEFSLLILGILAASILVKCYMAYYNHSVGKKIDSAAILAAATDSLSDCVSTAVVLATALVGHFTGLKIDGCCGLLVGVLIFISGIKAGKEILDPLLGMPPEKEFVDEIENFVVHYDDHITGIHDMIVHDYGPGRRYISLHAEVPCEGNILEIHDIIDNIEKKLSEKYGCLATIHMDPVSTSDPKVQEKKAIVEHTVMEIDETIRIHDFRMVEGATHTNLIFDVLVPFKFRLSDGELKKAVDSAIKKKMGKHFHTVISVDHDYSL